MPKSLSLEDRLRVLANAGELTYLSVVPVAGKGVGGVVYTASFSPASKWGHGMGRDPDPVNAIFKALDDERFKGLVKKLKIDTAELPMPTPADIERAAGPPAHEPAMQSSEEVDEPWLR